MNGTLEVAFLKKEMHEYGFEFKKILKEKPYYLLGVFSKEQVEFMIKIVPKRLYFGNQFIRQFVTNEFHIVEKMGKAPNGCLAFEDLVYTKNFLLLIYENPNMGQLLKVILEKGLTPDRLVILLVDLFSAVEELRSKGIFHKAISLSSLFVHNSRLALAGYEFCGTILEKDDGFTMKSLYSGDLLIQEIGDNALIPPEIITYEAKPNAKTPYFSIGIILCFLLTGKFPQSPIESVKDLKKFYQSGIVKVNASFKNDQINKKLINKNLKLLVREMLHVNLRTRIPTAEIIPAIRTLGFGEKPEHFSIARSEFYLIPKKKETVKPTKIKKIQQRANHSSTSSISSSASLGKAVSLRNIEETEEVRTLKADLLMTSSQFVEKQKKSKETKGFKDPSKKVVLKTIKANKEAFLRIQEEQKDHSNLIEGAMKLMAQKKRSNRAEVLKAIVGSRKALMPIEEQDDKDKTEPNERNYQRSSVFVKRHSPNWKLGLTSQFFLANGDFSTRESAENEKIKIKEYTTINQPKLSNFPSPQAASASKKRSTTEFLSRLSRTVSENSSHFFNG